MSMALAVYMPMLTLAVVALAVRPLHYTGCAYPMAGVPMPMPIPITQHRGQDYTQNKGNHGKQVALHLGGLE